jgi:phenylalanyl-tRNA synthetase beta chain
MTSITIPRHELEQAIKTKATAEVLHQAVMMGVEIDEATPEHITIDISPNRPDLLSTQGFARALAAFIGKAPGLRNYPTTPSKRKVFVDENVKNVRPYTACAIIKNLKLDEERLKEVIEIQEKLHTTFCRRRKKAAIGIYPLDAIEGNITYTALPIDKIAFRPLEAAASMTMREILAEHPKGKEFAHLVAGMTHLAVFMDNKKNILSVPPIINSHDTGKITTATTEAFLECSGYDQRTCQEVVRIISAALADMGASVHTMEVVYGRKTDVTPEMTSQRQEFYGYYVNRRLGTNIKDEEFAPLLAKMGLGLEKGRIKDTYYALLPPYRVDFLHPIDVVEDIAIAYGYERIIPVLPAVATTASETPRARFERVIRGILIGHGLFEAKNYHLLSRQYQTAFMPDHTTTDMCTLQSSVSEEYDALRATLLPMMLQAFSRNKTHEYPQGFFELGTVFSPAPTHVEETGHLCIGLAGDADYTRVRQLVDAVLAGVGKTGAYHAVDDHRFLKGRCAEVIVDGVALGRVGEIAPSLLVHAGLAVAVAAAELDCDVLRFIATGKES